MNQYERRIFDFIPEAISKGWAVSMNQFTRPSWNILIRAMSKNGILSKGESTEIILLERLKRLTIQDLADQNNVGSVRLEKLIEEVVNLDQTISEPFVYDAKVDVEEKLTLEQIILLLIATSDNWKNDFYEKFNFNYDELEFDDDLVSREIEIFSLRLGGLTLSEIGSRFGITRERVRQITQNAFNKIEQNEFFEGSDFATFLDKREKSQRGIKIKAELNAKLEIDLKVRFLLEKTPGLTLEQISKELGLDPREVANAIQLQTSKFLFQESRESKNESLFTDEEILEALRMAEVFESPVSAPNYRNLIDRGLVVGPGPQTVAKRFGTWKRACELAEVTYHDSVRDKYDLQWTQDQMLQYVSEFLTNKDFGKSFQSYDEWRVETLSDAPSGAHLRNNFGTWIDAKNASLMYMRRNKISPKLIS